MPYRSWGCSICGTQAPVKLRAHGMFGERMKWLREHYKLHHPDEFKRMTSRSVRTRAKRR